MFLRPKAVRFQSAFDQVRMAARGATSSLMNHSAAPSAAADWPVSNHLPPGPPVSPPAMSNSPPFPASSAASVPSAADFATSIDSVPPLQTGPVLIIGSFRYEPENAARLFGFLLQNVCPELRLWPGFLTSHFLVNVGNPRFVEVLTLWSDLTYHLKYRLTRHSNVSLYSNPAFGASVLRQAPQEASCENLMLTTSVIFTSLSSFMIIHQFPYTQILII